MKRLVSSLFIGLVMASSLAIASPASAQEVSRSVTITRNSKLGGQDLVKGDYSIRFVEGKDAEMSLMKGKKEVAKASYKMVKLTQPATDTSVVYMANTDGTFKVKRIEFKGKTDAISLE